ncbi:hypothetical protein GDO78_014576 [Eleutherodactylus coqui]|uniref:OAR domain-containing protein n=1 Tax=Eleutherodactylus coqui TaxID=57060 RepID=A0A8J6BES4_ELECQ|nr:hypothetical protein GDO78_014576 [Eleutherodactylus coqui]
MALAAGGPLCSCCVSDPLALSFLPPYSCQSHRTASVAALRMKAREHSEAVLQSAQILPSTGSSSGGSVTTPQEVAQERTSQVQEQNETAKSV